MTSTNLVVFYDAGNRTVVCAVADTGEPVWRSYLGERWVNGFTIDEAVSLLFVQGGTTMYGFDLATGAITWRVACGSGYGTAPVVFGDMLLYGTTWNSDLVMAFSMCVRLRGTGVGLWAWVCRPWPCVTVVVRSGALWCHPCRSEQRQLWNTTCPGPVETTVATGEGATWRAAIRTPHADLPCA